MHVHTGQVDDQEITATAELAPWLRPPCPPPRRFSAPKRMLSPRPTWQRSRGGGGGHVLLCAIAPPPPQPLPQEPLQLQLLPISSATEALPHHLYPIQLSFVIFLTKEDR